MHFIVTLVENSYLIGALALFNSLHRNGFTGTFIIGYRSYENLPQRSLQALEHHRDLNIVLLELDTPIHFTNYKPQFMKMVISKYLIGLMSGVTTLL